MPNTHLTRRELLAGAAPALVQAQANRPNILFILSDDHHFQCLGANGNPNIHTPNLDRLAARGVNFTNGVISTSQCCPSRGILLSGLETWQSGLLSNGSREFKTDMGPTVVEQLRRAGYQTTLVGKWHIDVPAEKCGFTHAPLWIRGGGMQYQNPHLRRGIASEKDETVPGHITDLFTDAGIESIRTARQPFLLWMAYNAPHSPLYAAAKYRQRYEGKSEAQLAPPIHPKEAKPFDWVTYYSVITHLDEAIGRLIAALEKAKLWDNTLIIFLGDNGFLCGTKGYQGKVYPYEESVRVPYCVSGGVVKGGVKSDVLAASVDLPATWLDFAGVKPARPLTGRSLKGVLGGGRASSAFDQAFVSWVDGRLGGLAGNRAVEPFRLVRTHTHKYIRWEKGREEMYAWPSDPGETKNLVSDAASTGVLRDLKKRLAARMEALGDPARGWKS